MKNIYFGLAALKTYAALHISHQILKNHTSYLVSSNTLLYSHNRYLYAPKSTLVLCSKIQREEVKFYDANRWLLVKSVEYWGMEDILLYKDLLKKDLLKTFKYDIGFYSSG